MTADDGVHRFAQPILIQDTLHGDVQLHRVHVLGGAGREQGVEHQALLHRGQWQHVGHRVALGQLVDLRLSQLGGQQIRRGQPAAAVLHMGADTAERLEPQLA